MSEFLHPGQHPDADQLSAFAEHVLPDYERVEILAHLAECADCRQIVFLAQPAQETQIPPTDAPVDRVGWWKNWGRLWPVAAALACGLLVTAFLERRQSRDIPQKSDVAFESAATPVSPLQEKVSPPVVPEVRSPEPAPSRKSNTVAKVAPSLHPPLAAPRSGADGFSSVHGSLATDHLANNPSLFSPNAPVGGQRKSSASSASSSSPGNIIGFPAAQLTPSQEQQNNPLNVNVNGAQPPLLKSQNQTFSQRAAALPPLSGPSQSDIQRSASQTVAVTNQAPVLQTESAVISSNAIGIGGPVPLRAIPPYGLRAPLPSKRPAISTISNGHETLAVDSAGDLFATENAGIRWRQIAHQWTGKAVKVSLASPNSMMRTAPSSPAGATAAINSEAAKPAPVAPWVGFELITDSGASWSSPDGLVWRPR